MLADGQFENGTLTVRMLKLLAGALGIAPLVASALLAGVLWIAAFGLAAGLPLAYLLFGAAVWVGSNYAFEVVEYRATGADGWPVLSIETMVAARHQLGSLFAVCAGLVVLLYGSLAASGHRDLAATVFVVGVAVGPAAVALLGVSRSPYRALDPRNLLKTAFGLGLYYIVVVAIACGCAWIGNFAYWHRNFSALFGAGYSVLVLAYFVGSAAYDRRLVLGVYAPRSPEALAEAEYGRLVTRRKLALDHAYGIAAHGSTSKALEHLRDYVSTEHDPLDARLWLFHEMARWEDGGPAIELGKTLAAELNDAERREEAAKVLVGCRYLEERTKPREGR